MRTYETSRNRGRNSLVAAVAAFALAGCGHATVDGQSSSSTDGTVAGCTVEDATLGKGTIIDGANITRQPIMLHVSGLPESLLADSTDPSNLANPAQSGLTLSVENPYNDTGATYSPIRLETPSASSAEVEIYPPVQEDPSTSNLVGTVALNGGPCANTVIMDIEGGAITGVHVQRLGD
ncbi:MAG TPA: hypothetical protein VJP80_07945 [Candidatus Saccharimonadales bacterium]|nr:hypothetical protein [Candidatus Saccharimonadales bacterium]